jgi:type VI secretion system protein ImpL
MLIKDISRIVLYGVGLGSLAALVWFAGPLIAFGDFRPLEHYIIREIVILLLLAGVASFGGWKYYLRRKGAKTLAEGVSEENKKDSDEVVLKEKLKDALATLKASSGGRKDYLYDLPWYLLIGPPGSGKTTALINSGLKFPLSRGAAPAAVAGVGGTRYCDWWFTEDAVLIDTAGRYTTQDSDATADKQSWLAFLDLLKKSRPRQPINGVMVAISLEDIMTLSSAELSAHADAIRARLLELHERLKVDFPVYALFTKGDLVAGFVEFFGFLGDNARKQVWGATFQTQDKTRNLVGEVPVEFDLLLERLSEEQLDRLQDEPAPDTRVLLFGFPAQMARLKQPLFNFLNHIFEPTRYHVNATLRGFYFTSGTQQGTPIDQLIGSLAKSFGVQEVAPVNYSGRGKSYFLHDLILKVVIGEAGWVSTDRAALRRAMIMKAAAYSAIALLTIGLSTLWLVSYQRNSALIQQTEAADKAYVEAAGPYIEETVIADRDLHKVLPLLDNLRALPAGYGARNVPTSLAETYGLSQRERLQSASENVYRIALERMLRSRLIFRLEELLAANMQNPGLVYDGLKVYLMLGGQQPPDREMIRAWMTRDWTTLYPGASNVAPIKRLEDHLMAMFDLATGDPLIELDGRMIEESQKTLARLSVAQRAYELLKSQARASTAGDWIAARKGGNDVARVFEAEGGAALDTIRVPEFFTYNGFHKSFIEPLGDIAERIKRERWVLGQAGDQQAVAAQYDSLPDEMLQIYSQEFLTTWRETLGKLRLRKLLVDKPQYVTLSALSAPTSPLKQLLVSIADETMLTRERPAPPPAGGDKPAAGAKPTLKPTATTTPKPLGALFRAQQGRAPGADIEAQFKGFHVAVEGQRAPIDDIVANLNEITSNLILAATTPSQVSRANQALQEQVSKLRNSAARLPSPFSDILRLAVGEFEGDVASTTAGQLLVALRDQVTPVCQQTVAGRYPFTRGSNREVPLADFARLFSPNGVMDKFFNQHLAPHADTSKGEWTWRQGAPITQLLSPATLRDFQRAAEIRDAFFQTGGNMPMVSLAMQPPISPGATVKFESGGAIATSTGGGPAGGGGIFSAPRPAVPPSSSPTTLQWPGASARTAISVDEGGPPSVLERIGPWSLFRMLEAGSLSVKGEAATATFIVGGRELRFQITTGSIRNPLNLALLREFRCPGGI